MMLALLLTGQPRITLKPADSELRVRAGQSVNLECIATGEPMPSVMWLSPQRGRAAVQPEVRLGNGSKLGRAMCLTYAEQLVQPVRVLGKASNLRCGIGTTCAGQWVKPVLRDGCWAMRQTCAGKFDLFLLFKVLAIGRELKCV